MIETIPFLDLKKVNKPYENDIFQALKKVVESGWYLLGKELLDLEKAIEGYYENDMYCNGVSSGFDALILMIQAHEFPEGSEIIVPANTYIATILAILNAKMKPVFVEPSIDDYLIDCELIETKINKNTVAILAVDLYGRCPDLKQLRKIADSHKLFLFSDSAQSFGATYLGNKPSKYYDAIALSFYPTKNLGAYGDAGAVLCKNIEINNRITALRNYGSEQKYVFSYLGRNCRMDEIQATILKVKMGNFEKELIARQQIAQRYLNEINNNYLVLPANNAVFEDSWHLFVIRCEWREALKSYLNQNGIGFDVHYPIPPHKQKALMEFSHLELPVTEKIHAEIISLPLNSGLSTNEVDYIVEKINLFRL